MKVLISGIQGFTGRYLATEMAQAGYDVYGCALKPDAEGITGVCKIYACDLADLAGLTQLMEIVRPDVVVHLVVVNSNRTES